MKIVRNLTTRPLRVRLPRGKTLHLGPRQEGEISVHAADFGAVVELVEAGMLEIVGDRAGRGAAGAEVGRTAAETHGHHPETRYTERGDR